MNLLTSFLIILLTCSTVMAEETYKNKDGKLEITSTHTEVKMLSLTELKNRATDINSNIAYLEETTAERREQLQKDLEVIVKQIEQAVDLGLKEDSVSTP